MTPDFEVSVATEIKEMEEKKTFHRPETTGPAPLSGEGGRLSVGRDFKGAERLPSPSPNRSPPAKTG